MKKHIVLAIPLICFSTFGLGVTIPQCLEATKTYTLPEDFSAISQDSIDALIDANLMPANQTLNATAYQAAAQKYIADGIFMVSKLKSYQWLTSFYNDFFCPVNSAQINQLYSAHTVSVDANHKEILRILFDKYSHGPRTLYQLFNADIEAYYAGDEQTRLAVNEEFLQDVANIVASLNNVITLLESRVRVLQNNEFKALNDFDSQIVNQKNGFCPAIAQATFERTKNLIINPPQDPVKTPPKKCTKKQRKLGKCK